MTTDSTDHRSARLASLWPVLPTRPQTLLLQSCLAPTDTVAQSWRQWCKQVRDPRRVIRRDRWGVRSILPLLYDSLRRADVKLDKDMQTTLRTAFFRERLRWATIHRICRQLLQALCADGIRPILAGDLAIAESAYPSPSLRHCGSLHLLIDAEDISRAIDCICSQNCRLLDRTGLTDHVSALFTEESGLQLQITSCVRHTPHSRDTLTDVWARTGQQRIDDTTVCVPCPADLLVAAMDYALLHGSWQSVTWVCDVCMLARRFNDQDWDTLLDIAIRNHLVWPSLVVLNYLSESFDLRVPESVLDHLGQAVGRNRKVCDDVATFCARSAVRSNLPLALRNAPGIRQFSWVIAEAVRSPLGKLRRTLR